MKVNIEIPKINCDLTGDYSYVENEEVLRIALAYSRGSYQRNLILGSEALSGATLRGKAKSYSGRYRQSADNLVSRLEGDDRLDVSEIWVGSGSRRCLRIVYSDSFLRAEAALEQLASGRDAIYSAD